MLPKIFIGSSGEARDKGLLEAIRVALDNGINAGSAVVEIVPWSAPNCPWSAFAIAMQSLEASLADYSFAVFILSADDEAKIRDADCHIGRDNVLFEFGLFYAHLGPERTFFVAPKPIDKTVQLKKLGSAGAVERPLHIMTDLGSGYRKGHYEVDSSVVPAGFTCHLEDIVAAIKTQTLAFASSAAARTKLNQLVQQARAAISESNKPDAYYSGKLSSRLGDVIAARAAASHKPVANVVEDILLILERVDDFCDATQLAAAQSHTRGIGNVWVFADEPLEFTAAAVKDAGLQALRQTILENVKNDVEYTYFVSPRFDKSSIESLIPATEPNRNDLLSRIHIVLINDQFFSTYFTFHFAGKQDDTPSAIFMSAMLQDRRDLLIQVSDLHTKRIHKCIRYLKGKLENQYPKVTRFVIPV